MNMNLSELDKIASKVNPDFMEVCEVLVVVDGDNYMIPQNGVWMNINKDVVIRDMNTRRRRTLVVNANGGILDTNMILCEECGVPVISGDYCKECNTPIK